MRFFRAVSRSMKCRKRKNEVPLRHCTKHVTLLQRVEVHKLCCVKEIEELMYTQLYTSHFVAAVIVRVISLMNSSSLHLSEAMCGVLNSICASSNIQQSPLLLHISLLSAITISLFLSAIVFITVCVYVTHRTINTANEAC